MVTIHKVLDCEDRFYCLEGRRSGGSGLAHCLSLMFVVVGCDKDRSRYRIRTDLCDSEDVTDLHTENLTIVSCEMDQDFGCVIHFRVEKMGAQYSLRLLVSLVEVDTGKVVAQVTSRKFQQCTKRKSSSFPRKSTLFAEEKQKRDDTKAMGLERLRKYAPLFRQDPVSALKALEKEPKLEEGYPIMLLSVRKPQSSTTDKPATDAEKISQAFTALESLAEVSSNVLRATEKNPKPTIHMQMDALKNKIADAYSKYVSLANNNQLKTSPGKENHGTENIKIRTPDMAAKRLLANTTDADENKDETNPTTAKKQKIIGHETKRKPMTENFQQDYLAVNQ